MAAEQPAEPAGPPAAGGGDTGDLSYREKVRLLPWSIAHTATNAVFAVYTVFGSVFILFLDELGLDKARIGLVLSLLPLAGLLAVFVAPAVGRAGLKRTFLVFWSIRKVVIAGLLLTPLVRWRFGDAGAFTFVTLIVLGFAVCRAIAETAWYPWFQEVVPDSIRGRFGAVSNIVTTLAMAGAAAAGSFVVGRQSGLGRFLILIAVGVCFGFLAVWAASRIPGGRAVRREGGSGPHWRQMRSAVADRGFLRYLAAQGLIMLGWAPLWTFVPLYAKDQLGLGAGTVVLLESAGLLGQVACSYLWGWLADRRGGKCVLLTGLLMTGALTLAWLAAPRYSALTRPVALALAVAGGLAGVAWHIGSSRLLYVAIVPAEKKTPYMSIHYAWTGLTGGGGPILAGWSLDRLAHTGAGWETLRQFPYVPVFAACALLIFAGAFLMRKVRSDRPADGPVLPADRPGR